MRILILLMIIFSPMTPCSMAQTKDVTISQNQTPISACVQAGGKLSMKKECDGSENEYCYLTNKIHCYADQVINGHCTVEFSEELYKTTGDGMKSGPRVMCDNGQ